MRTMSRIAAGLCLLMLGACASEEKLDRPVFEPSQTAIDYEITLEGMPEEDLVALAEASLAVYRRQDDGAQSIAFLKRRAEGDVALLNRILRSRGYYNGEVTLKVRAGEKVEGEEGDPPATVAFVVEPGEAFILARHDFQVDDPSGTVPELSADALGSPVGEAAVASGIVDAETAAIVQLKRSGYPYAERGKRRAVADLEAREIEVDTPVTPGPAGVFGELTFEGLEAVKEEYLITYVPWEIGDTFDDTLLRKFQREIIGTDLFDTVRVFPPETPPDGPGPVPLQITAEASERPFRTVSAGVRYNTDQGPLLTGGYEHRNLYGANETLTVKAGLGLQLQGLGIGYREPQYLRPGQDFLASFTVIRETDDAFDDVTATLTAGLERELSPQWTVGAGGLFEVSQIRNDADDSTAVLLGIPAFADYDGSDDLLNPTRGARFRIEATPYGGMFDGDGAAFLSIDSTGSTYYDLTGEKDYVLAGRARLGSILAGDLEDVPQTRRLYSGGGGSVRGYAYRFIGPLDITNDPTGGLSAMELGVEARARLYGDLGGVAFVEAGSVSEESFPDFDEGVQAAAGAGFRYYSPAGPIRVDVAFPLNRRDADDAWQLYFSIGQAF